MEDISYGSLLDDIFNFSYCCFYCASLQIMLGIISDQCTGSGSNSIRM